MPEYLAPGVYVEEVSFRSKSIEGVGTSTTAFVGPARKGPIAPSTNERADLPELLSSFADFVRLFGGLEDLEFGPNNPPERRLNHLAHAAFNYFNEGGSRLYVMRVASADATAAANVLRELNPVDANQRVAVRARYRGSGGNGRILFRETVAPATIGALRTAPPGSLARASGNNPAEPARLRGNVRGPFRVPNGAVLRLRLNGAPAANDLNVTIAGQQTELVSDQALNPVDLTAANAAERTLVVTLNNDPPQNITVPAQNYATRHALLNEVRSRLNNGYALLNANDRLVIGTIRRGFSGRVQAQINVNFGFAAAGDQPGAAGANNTVPNLDAVTAADLQALLEDNALPAPHHIVIVRDVAGQLEISSRELGENQTVEIIDATDAANQIVSAHTALGLPVRNPGDPIARGSNVRLYRKMAAGRLANWQAADGDVIALGADDEVNNRRAQGNLITVSFLTRDSTGEEKAYEGVSFSRESPRHFTRVLSLNPEGRAQSLYQLFGFEVGNAVEPLDLHAALFPAGQRQGDIITGFTSEFDVAGGTDGNEPVAGIPTDAGTYAAAFEQLRAVEDVSIVAAPGHSASPGQYEGVQRLLLAHAERPRAFRIAVLDPRPQLTPSEVREARSRIDSHRAAFYYPWVVVANPLARPGREDIPSEIALPPSGFICGVYARNDVLQDVSKAPANEVVRGALRFESDINFAQNQLLNPLGVNCLRFFPGRGFRVWGARTASSDPEWKYVNVRRYFIYLEASIDRGTQWAVFENNGPRLWQNIRETVEDFLYNEWVSNRLLGETPKQAYFVRCDRSTMTQNDLDNGRLICLIGVSVLKPAEFVIFRIGQKTADARS